MSKQPPIWIIRFFRWFCRQDLADAVEGDLIELYMRKAEAKGRFRANVFFFFHVLTFFQPFAFRRNHEQYKSLNFLHMFFSYFKTGLRFTRKNKGYAAINIFGLAVGISAFLLMALFVSDELSYDRFHKRGENILRLSYQLETPNATRYGAKLPFPVKEVLLSEYPEVQSVARFYYWSGDTPLLEYDEHKHTENEIYFAETSTLALFDFEFVSGDPSKALEDPRSIIVTESMAKKYFGNDDPLGKVMRYKNEDNLVVTGVMKDVPENSHITFDFLLPIELQRQRWLGWGRYTYDLEKDWNWAAAWVYAEMVPGTDIAAFEQKLQSIAKEHLNTEEQGGFSIQTQPLFDIHLKSDKSAEARANGNMNQVYSFGGIGLLILLIACVNFINLNSAQLNTRLKEIGLRKVVGARKGQLIGQFLTESMLLVVSSAGIGLLMANLSLPMFNRFTNKNLVLGLEQSNLFLALLSLVMLIGLLSGLRPSLLAVRTNALQGLANKFKLTKARHHFTKTMVVGQFLICNLLILGILVVNNQLNFLQNKDLGFDKEEVMILRHGRNMTEKQYDLFRNKLERLPAVVNVNRGYVAGTSGYTNTFKVVGSETEDSYSLGIKWVGEGFTDAFGVELLVGRNFDEELTASRGSQILINEAAAKALGWTLEESLGKKLSFLPGGNDTPIEIQVIGVLADANFESLYDPVMPSVFRRPQNSVGSVVSLKLAAQTNVTATIDDLEAAWDEVMPQWPFEFSFLDQLLDEHYKKEERLAAAIQYFAILAIFIACLGLFGLSSFAVQQRTKEIGIRKVSGASIFSILMLISKRFIWLIGIAFVISVPLGFYLFRGWLQGFAYQISLSPELFLLAGVLSLVVALVAIGQQSLKAATTDPVKTLRHE